MTRLFSFDTETKLLAPAIQAPPLACLQWAFDDDVPQIAHVNDPACRRTIVEALSGGALWNGHNLAFDVCVIMAKWPDLIDAFFDLYDRDEATCTILLAKLADIARGRFKVNSNRGYDLGKVARWLRLPIEVDKEDPWRMRYGTLIDTPVHFWDPLARQYALKDVIAQRLVYRGVIKYAEDRGIPLVDQFRQARAALWLRLMECRGIRVDRRRAEEYIATVQLALDVDRETCLDAGLVDLTGKKETFAAMAHMVAVCREAEEDDLPLTETGEKQCKAWLGIDQSVGIPKGATWRWYATLAKPACISLNEDSVQLYGDELLESYQRYATARTQLDRAKRLFLAAVNDLPIQSSFGPLQDTGRTSCSQGDKRDVSKAPAAYGSQLHNPAKDKRIKRLCPAGWITDPLNDQQFLDPRSNETVSRYYLRKGVREMFVARDGHYLAPCDIDSAELCAVAQVCTEQVGFSKLAEVLNEGRDPHTELGAELRDGLTVAEAYIIRKGELGKDAKKLFDNEERQSAKIGNFGFWGSMGPPKLALQARKQYGVQMTVEKAKVLKQAFVTKWTEFPEFRKWAKKKLTEGTDEDRRGVYLDPRSGRLRGDMWLAALMNTTFQGRVADLFKDAGWRATREMYTGRFWDRSGASPLAGSGMANQVHDELIPELLIANAHAAAFRVAEILMERGRHWAPAVKWGCTPALCRRWYKSAEAVYDPSTGLLAPWEPDQKHEKRDGRLYVVDWGAVGAPEAA